MGLLQFAMAAMAIFLWSRFHMSRQRASLQLYVEDRSVVSLHWTPLPEWLGATRRDVTNIEEVRAISVPRRVVLIQLREWIAQAHACGFKELRLDSPLFVTLGSDDAPVARSTIARSVGVLADMPEVDRVVYSAPARLPALQAVAYKLFWPAAAKRAHRSHEGQILAASIVIYLSQYPECQS
jgi:hypothetical protein